MYEPEVDCMLSARIITTVEYDCASTIVLASKKDGSSRFCIYFRKLIAVMKPDRWPLPRFDEIFNEVGGNTLLTTLDFFRGYEKIKMDKSCTEKTIFYVETALPSSKSCHLY